ncbi:SapC family protein [Aquicoccus sp. G2-2]|uniref:SapC family protein n=1 Tax=Aquicoccus sp. G2-2 TaxID=3092120 RepID=UPI002ADFC7CB|nr:SapC family protein [Aquicoccus sp. G2-2]MEA1112280.1 SapC family protein [Aquicoccus sp. G2-2]
MANPLFYNNVVPLNTKTHKNLRLATPKKPLAFAEGANLIPALVDEFEEAVDDLPIAFLPGNGAPAAVFVTGLKPGTNVFVSKEGLWDGKYAPAYLRRYPFIVGDVTDGEPILCVDDTYEGLNESEGDRFFSKTGESEETLMRALTLSQSYKASAERTDQFAKMLHDMELFHSISLDAVMPDGEKTSVHGLMVVDEDALAGLSGDNLQKLNEAGFLKAIYCHLLSLKAISRLGKQSDVASPDATEPVQEEA